MPRDNIYFLVQNVIVGVGPLAVGTKQSKHLREPVIQQYTF